VGPVEDSTRPAGDGEAGQPAKRRHRPRARRCLLKGCEHRFRPRRARQRYCSAECRRAARKWSRWKAQQGYRATAAGKEKRNRQSRRYRERRKNRRQSPPPEAVAEPARVITQDFFRPLLRPPGLLQGIHLAAALTPAAFLFACMPTGHGTSLATRATLAPRSATTVADLSSRRPR
jgi:hypothetical protein